MGRLGAARDGVGAHQQESRIPRRRGRNSVRPADCSWPTARCCSSVGFRRPVPAWGWRIPFLLSIVMVGVGLWIRLGIMETPVFQKILDEERIERVPVLEVLRRQPKQIILTALLRLPEQAPGYIVGALIFTYATTVLGQSRDFVLIRRDHPDNPGLHLGRLSPGASRTTSAARTCTCSAACSWGSSASSTSRCSIPGFRG